MTALIIVFGFVFLLLGAEGLVDGASESAIRFRHVSLMFKVRRGMGSTQGVKKRYRDVRNGNEMVT